MEIEKIIEEAQEMFQKHKETHDFADLRTCIAEVVGNALLKYDGQEIMLVDQILGMPLVSDKQSHQLTMKCHSNGKGPVWNVEYKRSGPIDPQFAIEDRIIILDDDFDNQEMRGLEGLLRRVLNILKRSK